MQTDSAEVKNPAAFCSMKLHETQRRWSTIDREAFDALSCLQKYRSWLFGSKVTIHSDHKPLLYLTESAAKKLEINAVGIGPAGMCCIQVSVWAHKHSSRFSFPGRLQLTEEHLTQGRISGEGFQSLGPLSQ